MRCIFANLKFTAKRPLPGKNPVEPRTIGEHIRKKRMDLQMKQKALSQLFKVSENTITYWEMGRSRPHVKYYPRIIEFLGYVPFDLKELSLGKQLYYARLIAGLNHIELGKKMEVVIRSSKLNEKERNFLKRQCRN